MELMRELASMTVRGTVPKGEVDLVERAFEVQRIHEEKKEKEYERENEREAKRAMRSWTSATKFEKLGNWIPEISLACCSSWTE